MRVIQGAKYGYIWAGSNFCCFVFFYMFVPETKGRTLEEIDELFANRVSVRNFTYSMLPYCQAILGQRAKQGPPRTSCEGDDLFMRKRRRGGGRELPGS